MFQRQYDGLRERLLRAGIAPRHVRRYVRELEDHFDDLVREETAKGSEEKTAEQAAQARIGSEEELAAVMLARPEIRSVAARCPWAVFGLGPLLALSAILIVAVVVEAGFLELHRALFYAPDAHPVPPEWLKLLVALWNWLTTHVAPPAVALAFFVIAARQRMAVGWAFLGFAVICLLGSFFEVALWWSDGAGQDELSLTFALAPPFPRELIVAGAWRFAINVVLVGTACWVWLHRKPSLRSD